MTSPARYNIVIRGEIYGFTTHQYAKLITAINRMCAEPKLSAREMDERARQLVIAHGSRVGSAITLDMVMAAAGRL